MKIAIYGREFNNTVLAFVQQVFDTLADFGIELAVYEDYGRFISGKIDYPKKFQLFKTTDELLACADVMLSLGGDGTMLDAVNLIRRTGIPVIGINFGRLGFLASINKDDIKDAIDQLTSGAYSIDERAVLQVQTDRGNFSEANFALNDITIHRRDNSAMMIIHAYLNGEFLNSYWADGIIVATPTGSTAYSLSCGGPIIFPQSGNFVVTPISPHNLNVRPIVVSDTNVLSFEVEGRSSKYLLTCDSRTETIANSINIQVQKADFCINLIRLNNESYLSTLRKKLLWGIDTRNY